MIHFLARALAGALHNNPFFNGGFVLMALGAMAAGLRPALSRLWWAIETQCFVYVEVTNHDPAYEYLQEWMAKLPRAPRFRTLSITSREQHNGGLVGPDEVHPTRSKLDGVRFAPSPGVHFAFYQRRLIWIERKRNQDSNTHGTNYRESLVLKVVCRDPAVARRIVETAVAQGRPDDQRLITVWQLDQWGNNWSLSGRRLPRSLESVLLPDGVMEALVIDCERYLAARDWYESLGIPYRRGYLLHGTPGTGKTSTVAAIASRFHADIYVLSLAAGCLSDQNLSRLVAAVPAGDILLLEDVDALRVQRDEGREGKGITFSGLLNSLDGIHTSEGRLLFMTTNHPERLDPALTRPGRIDYQVEFGMATFAQAERLYQRFFPAAEELAARRFAARVPLGALTMAQLLQHLLIHAGCPAAALASPLPLAALPAAP